MTGHQRADTRRVAVVLLAAGAGRRVGGDANKVLLPLGGLPVFAWSLRRIEALDRVDRVVLVVRDEDRDSIEGTLTRDFADLRVALVTGGSTRHASEWNALQALAEPILAGTIDLVAIHDAARPLAGVDLFRGVLDCAAVHGAALPVRERPDLLPREGEAGADALVAVQTPQAFRARPLLEAYRQADSDGFVGTDTAHCIEKYTDLEVHGVPGPATNLKVTFPEDVALAERLLAKLPGT